MLGCGTTREPQYSLVTLTLLSVAGGNDNIMITNHQSIKKMSPTNSLVQSICLKREWEFT